MCQVPSFLRIIILSPIIPIIMHNHGIEGVFNHLHGIQFILGNFGMGCNLHCYRWGTKILRGFKYPRKFGVGVPNFLGCQILTPAQPMVSWLAMCLAQAFGPQPRSHMYKHGAPQSSIE